VVFVGLPWNWCETVFLEGLRSDKLRPSWANTSFLGWFVVVLWVIFDCEQNSQQASFEERSLPLVRFGRKFFYDQDLFIFVRTDHSIGLVFFGFRKRCAWVGAKLSVSLVLQKLRANPALDVLRKLLGC
jgi:hypothetical protein